MARASVKTELLSINDYASITKKQNVLKSGKLGKARVTFEIQAQPVVFNMDSRLLKEMAVRLEQDIKRKLDRGGAPVIAKTADERAVAERAYSKGKRWSVRQYSGGKVGATPPSPGERNEFKHSGRLANGVKARYVARSKQWIINVPANRLNPKDFETPQRYRNFLNRLIRQAPNLDPRRYVKSSEWHRNLGDWVDNAIKVIKRNKDLKAQQRKMAADTLRAVLGYLAR